MAGTLKTKNNQGEHTTLEIGNDNEIREHATIHRGTGCGGAKTIVGDKNLFMVGSHIAHDCIIGNEIILANQVMLAGHVKVEDAATIGEGPVLTSFHLLENVHT